MCEEKYLERLKGAFEHISDVFWFYLIKTVESLADNISEY